MRIKINGSLLEKTVPDKSNYSYCIYQMILNNLEQDCINNFNIRQKNMRLFTFTNIYMPKLPQINDNLHFYISGEDSIINQLINSITTSRNLSIGDMKINVSDIKQLKELERKDHYLFKSNIVINIPQNNKTVLLENLALIEGRLRANAVKKANLFGIDGDVHFSIADCPQKCVEQYKSGHVFSWKCLLQVKGDYDVINTIYNCGAGENTATGHGFLWEV